MISERIAVRAFESIWRTRFPMLTPAFMKSFNEELVKPIVHNGSLVAPLPVNHKSNSPDLVAELGIQMTKSAVEAHVSVEDVARDQGLLQAAWVRSLRLISRYDGKTLDVDNVSLSTDDSIAALALARTMSGFLAQMDNQVEFEVLIPGAGTLSRCEADLAIGHQLVEVKTVSRSFRSHDLRQLFVYLALEWASGEPRWTKGCLLNPRRAVWADFDVEWLVRLLSGHPAVDAFRDLLDAFSGSVELETTLF